MHRSHLPLKTWFMAVHIVTSHSNGISALQLQAQLGLGSYKRAQFVNRMRHLVMAAARQARSLAPGARPTRWNQLR